MEIGRRQFPSEKNLSLVIKKLKLQQKELN